MKPKISLTILGAAALLLAGCGGSGTNPVTPPPAAFGADAVTLQAKYTDPSGNLLAGVTPAAAVDIPAAGTASYTGYVSGDLGGDAFYGDLTVDAAFATNTVSSSATGFQHETEGAYTGTLTGTGPLVRTPPMGVPQVSTSLDGTLANGGTNYVTSIALEGDLLAEGTDPVGAVAGTADGTVGAGFLVGVFAAE